MAGSVFLSYRRSDVAGHAGRLYDHLQSRFPNRVFMDVGGIEPGSDFRLAIENAVGNCRVLIALIGRRWLSEDRILDPGDFVRLEIASALKRGIRVIPVLVEGATLPQSGLPPDVEPLLLRQALEIRDTNWDADCEKLIGAIASDIGRGRSAAGARNWILAGVGLALIVTVILVANRPTPPRPGGDPKEVVVKAHGQDVDKQTLTKYVCAQYNGFQAAADSLNEITRQMDGASAPPKIALDPIGRWNMAIRGEGQKVVPIEFLADYTAFLGNGGANASQGCWRYGGTWNLLRFDFPDGSHTNLELQVGEAGAGRFVASANKKIYEFTKR